MIDLGVGMPGSGRSKPEVMSEGLLESGKMELVVLTFGPEGVWLCIDADWMVREEPSYPLDGSE